VVHYGLAPEAIEQRRAVLDAAYSAHPERFVRKPPQPLPAPTEVWINKPQQLQRIKLSKLCFEVSQTC
jgi:putative transposase